MHSVLLTIPIFVDFSLTCVTDSCFGSGSIDGTIILWTAHNLLPAKQFNTVSKYQGVTKGFPYSVQSLFCVQEVGAQAGIYFSYSSSARDTKCLS
jgi:hypothetical protein